MNNSKQQATANLSEVDKALEALTMEMFNSLDKGEELVLTANYNLYRYFESDVYVVINSLTENEEYQVQIDDKDNHFFIEL